MVLDSIGSSPMFPTKITVLDYRFLVNQLKMGTAQKGCFFECAMNVRTLVFLKILYKLGFIRKYVRLTAKTYRIFPNWRNGRSTIKHIRFFQVKTPLKLTVKALSILRHVTFNSFLILETDRGLMTHRDAIDYKLGGHLICSLL